MQIVYVRQGNYHIYVVRYTLHKTELHVFDDGKASKIFLAVAKEVFWYSVYGAWAGS